MAVTSQLAPAETLQPVDDTPVITLRFGLGLLALSLAMIGVHWVWANWSGVAS